MGYKRPQNLLMCAVRTTNTNKYQNSKTVTHSVMIYFQNSLMNKYFSIVLQHLLRKQKKHFEALKPSEGAN